MNSANAEMTLKERLADSPPILIDGGTGAEIERMGATMHPEVWSARATLTEPDIVRAVHNAFLSAGAEIIIANTYPANYHVMAAAGLSHEFESANQRALELAHEARTEFQKKTADRAIWVAGSMSTTTFSPGLDETVINTVPTPGEGYRAQAEIIADVGVDVIILEMMRDVTETRLCLDAALATGLPVWLGLSAEHSAAGTLTFHGSEIPLADGVQQILAQSRSLQAVGVMHSELTIGEVQRIA
ncbi:MAG: homocysteine S-methyltransferase family protein [Alkalispirochaeta sp.]